MAKLRIEPKVCNLEAFDRQPDVLPNQLQPLLLEIQLQTLLDTYGLERKEVEVDICCYCRSYSTRPRPCGPTAKCKTFSVCLKIIPQRAGD